LGDDGGRLLAEKGKSGIIVWLWITKSTASVALLGNDGTCTFASVEAATAIRTVGVTGARTRDELCTISGDDEGH
jgi:hypothetical protein